MRLFYFDHHAEHEHLWECLDERFCPIPEDWDDDVDFERRVDAFFQAELGESEPPVLLIFHISEQRTNRQPFVLSRELYESWPQRAHIYTVLVTGGETPSGELSKHGLPETHFHPYSLKAIVEDWPDAERDAWQGFILQLEQSGRANWALLSPPSRISG